MNKRSKVWAIWLAILAAALYAINMPVSKILLESVPPTILAAFLYLGAGIGIGIPFLLKNGNGEREKLTRKDLPYTIGMIVLDILAPIFLMFGLLNTTSANASLLNNFEIVATSIIALVVFKEAISKRLWLAIALVALSSAILSFEDMPSFKLIAVALVLGFVAYGLSIFFYIWAQSVLGAAKTSAYYAIAPFLGSALSFLLLREPLSLQYGVALLVMLAGSALVVADTLYLRHTHIHTHTITHTHDGTTHTHTYTHKHSHTHRGDETIHTHRHDLLRLAH